MNALRRAEGDAPRRLRFVWDYSVLLDWSADTEGDDLPDVEELLPADLARKPLEAAAAVAAPASPTVGLAAVAGR